MQVIKIKPAKNFKGVIAVPGDKSISHRSAIIGSITDGVVEISNFLCSADCLATLRAVQSMGVKVEGFGSPKVRIYGAGLRGLKKPSNILDLENSGTGTRLIVGLVSGCQFSAEITGDESLKKRPMLRIVEPLKKMGAEIEGDKCPLKIQGGRLKGIDYVSPVASAQVKSCLLIAGLLADGITSVTEPAKSRDHTERMLKYFDADIKIDGLKVSVRGGKQLKAKPIKIPGDLSSAAFMLAGGVIVPGGYITIKNVGINPTRIAFLNVLKRMGANLEISKTPELQDEPVADITVRHSKLQGINIGVDEVPSLIDELPIIAVLASAAAGKTVVSGAKELRVKESDRIKTVADNLAKFGVAVEEKEDGWIINGGRPVKGSIVQSFGDHRIAMAMTIFGLVASGETIIEDTEWINTSFPGFMDLINKLMA